MVYLYDDILSRYTILVGNPRYVRERTTRKSCKCGKLDLLCICSSIFFLSFFNLFIILKKSY